MRKLPPVWAVLLVMGGAVLTASATTPPGPPAEPFNRVVVIFDTSGSFRPYLETAWPLVDKHLRQYRRSREDELIVINLNERPAIVFDGRGDQGRKAREAFAGLAKASRACCTDLAGALNLAAFLLSRDPVPAAKLLLIFSDLVHEPHGRPVPPPTDLDWAGLRDASVRAYFVPVSELQKWQPLLASNGVRAELYNPKQSENQALEQPGQPVLGAEGSFLAGALRLAGVAFAGVVSLVLVASGLRSLASWMRRRRGGSPLQEV